MGVQVGQILRQAALRAPERVALYDAGHDGTVAQQHTYAELDLAARRAASVLIEHGVKPGQCVALCAENSAQFVAAWFGIVYAGAAVVPVPIASSAPELAHRLKHARCSVLLYDHARHELATRALASSGEGLRSLVLSALSSSTSAPVSHPLDTSASATAMILYTSGTTGTAKGAEISHASLMLHTTGLVQHALSLGREDVVLCALPLTHSYGCRMAMLAPFYAQAQVVMTPRFEARRTLSLLAERRVTWLPAVPTMLAAWSQLNDAASNALAAELQALRWVLSAGAPLPDALALRAEARLGVEVRQGFGMTEATFAAINAPPDARVLGCVGKATWGVELRIVDDAGGEVAPGETGELLVRGHNVMTRYLHDAEASLEAAPDGWMHSGDIARVDGDGRLWVVDRSKDLVIRGGFNVYPSEVETVLAQHEGVAEVAVIGRPDDTYGEEVVAVIVPRAGLSSHQQTELHAALVLLASQQLSRTKQPREYAFTAALPLGASGKVQKRELRAWLLEGKLSVVNLPP